VTASRVRFRFWLETAVTPGAGGGGVDDLVLAVFLLLGVSFSPSNVVWLAALFVAFNWELHVVCLLAGSAVSAHLRFLEATMMCVSKRCCNV
jgi:hypothetical protein